MVSRKLTATEAREMAGHMRGWAMSAERRVEEAEGKLQRARADLEMWRKGAEGMDALADGLES